MELAAAGVSVTIIAPDWVQSEILQRSLDAQGQPLGHSPLDQRNLMALMHCAQRIKRGIARRERLVLMSGRSKNMRLGQAAGAEIRRLAGFGRRETPGNARGVAATRTTTAQNPRPPARRRPVCSSSANRLPARCASGRSPKPDRHWETAGPTRQAESRLRWSRHRRSERRRRTSPGSKWHRASIRRGPVRGRRRPADNTSSNRDPSPDTARSGRALQDLASALPAFLGPIAVRRRPAATGRPIQKLVVVCQHRRGRPGIVIAAGAVQFQRSRLLPERIVEPAVEPRFAARPHAHGDFLGPASLALRQPPFRGGTTRPGIALPGAAGREIESLCLPIESLPRSAAASGKRTRGSTNSAGSDCSSNLPSCAGPRRPLVGPISAGQ